MSFAVYTGLSNWVVYYCYASDWRGYQAPPAQVHACELPNSASIVTEYGAKDTWNAEYNATANRLVAIAAERVPDDWYNSGNMPAGAYYMRRSCAIRGIPITNWQPDAKPEPTPDDIMDAVRSMSKSHF